MSTPGFSSILKLTELDDFIAPSQECIKPAQPLKPTPQPSAAKVRIELEDVSIGGVVPQVPQKVEINLTDCLACSGCITSAESILISQQSPEELVRILEKNKNSKAKVDNNFLAIVTLGTQAVISLARKYLVPPQEMAERLAGFFKDLGADKVITITLAEDLCLIESGKEFVEKLENINRDPTSLPIISGVCPGWVCYAEKLHPYAIKNISRVKSPQQIMGSLLKLVYGPRVNHSPDEIYHVSLMSCFDRKLEASRKDFILEEYRSKEVDSVITPLEIENLLESIGKHLLDYEPANLDNPFEFGNGSLGIGASIMSHLGSGSGGFAEYIFRIMSAKHGIQADVTWIVGRNPDISEAVIPTPTGDLKFSVATGFRNIQTIVRKLKTKMRANLPHYIEIMACPTGCLNGGAQLRSQDSEQGGRELSCDLEKMYHELPAEILQDNPFVEQIYNLLGNPDGKLYNDVLYTDFHAIEKSNLGIKW
ncbi:unnamed protein product [Allacma fusca]|uniref:Iron hydrogenase large subunit C-terminal domain-containing protein n=1 Tax=Allacma fusca TaxID=39272 RepID=A0A8J2PWG9_9HEXA|nr:unnamed protein product [Allacma fusca]